MSVEEDSPQYIIIPESLSRCKCCFDDNNLKSMWDVYSNDGEQEVYGDMIGECFAISVRYLRKQKIVNPPSVNRHSCKLLKIYFMLKIWYF